MVQQANIPGDDKIEIKFVYKKETKNTIQFEEVVGETSWSAKDTAVGPLYVQKEALKTLADPMAIGTIKVTIEVISVLEKPRPSTVT